MSSKKDWSKKTCNMDIIPKAPTSSLFEIENSIIKTYHKPLFVNFVKAIKEFQLLEPGDVVGIAISGGKDSLLMAKLFQELKKHNKFPFELKYISMNPGFTPTNLELLKMNCEYLNIPVQISESHIFDVVQKIASDNPCFLCAKMRRGFLYNFAQSIGCNKLALAHHFNDVIETTLLNVFYGAEFKTMVPKVQAENFENMTLIRPMIYINEHDINRWKIHNDITCMDCGCIVKAVKTASKRAEIKDLIADLTKINPRIEKNIFTAATNVNLDAIIGYHQNGESTDFNQIFDKNKNERTKR